MKNRSLFDIDPSRWKCTAAKAAACGLPRGLEDAAIALDLPIKKNMDGNRLVKKHMKPRPKWKAWNEEGRKGPEPVKWYENEFERWAIYDYCKTDAEVERLLDNSLPDLSPSEKIMWEINQRANQFGIKIDIEAVKKIIAMIKSEEKRLIGSLPSRTNGEIDSVSKIEKVVEWTNSKGVFIPNFQAATVQEYLAKDNIPEDVKYVLLVRSLTSKTSNKKYFGFLDRTCSDGRAKDILMFHGAGPGRDSGTGIQVHNFPRGNHKNTNGIIDDILNYDIEILRVLYGDLISLFSSCLRGMITASPGYELHSADYNAIECRIANWLSGNESVLSDFRAGQDPYKKMASKIFNKPIEEITEDERFLGKIAELACAYGMGWERFLTTCISWGAKDVTEAIAKKAVQVYRETHTRVVSAWYGLERAAISAIRNPGRVYKIHKIGYYVKDNFLWCVLPSGRKIAYHKPSIRMKKTPWGEMKASIHFWGVDSQTKQYKQFHTYGGSLLENVCQGTAACILRNGQINSIKNGFRYLFNVHDELVNEAKIGSVKLEKDSKGKLFSPLFIKSLETLPSWAEGLPVKASGWVGPRFKK